MDTQTLHKTLIDNSKAHLHDTTNMSKENRGAQF